MRGKTNSLVIISLYVAIGIILQITESTFPIITTVPGGKLGLANIVSILNISMFGGVNALVVALLRAFLGSLLFGGVSSMIYSVSGAFLSTICMSIFMKFKSEKYGSVSVGIIGAVTHNLAQVAVASLILGSVYIWSYFPVLMIIGAISGAVTGFSSGLIKAKIKLK